MYRFGSKFTSVSIDNPYSESRDGCSCVVTNSRMPFWRGWAFFGGRFPSFCGRSVFPRSPLLLCWISIVDSHSFYSGVVNLEKPHCSKNRPSFFQPPPRDLDGIFCILFSFCKEMKKEEIESTVFACIALDLEYTLHNVVKRVV